LSKGPGKFEIVYTPVNGEKEVLKVFDFPE
jgi:hypothetical protein